MISHGWPRARKGVSRVDLVVEMIWRGQGDIEMGTMVEAEGTSMGWCLRFRRDVANEVGKGIGGDDRDLREFRVRVSGDR
jgi:hypothetical protein